MSHITTGLNRNISSSCCFLTYVCVSVCVCYVSFFYFFSCFVCVSLSLVRRALGIPLVSEISSLTHVPRPLDEMLSPVELRALVSHAKELAKKAALSEAQHSQHHDHNHTSSNNHASVTALGTAQTIKA